MDQNNPLIICDTNIWYRLSDGTIDTSKAGDKQLIGTFVSAQEFCCTHLAYSNYSKFRKAVIAFKTIPAKNYTEEQHIKAVSGRKSFSANWSVMSKLLDNVQGIEHYDAPSSVQENYIEYDSQLNELLKPLESIISEHRNLIRSKGAYKKAMNSIAARQESLEITKRLLVNLSGGPLEWDRLELFLNTFDEWIRQLSIQSNLRMNIPHAG